MIPLLSQSVGCWATLSTCLLGGFDSRVSLMLKDTLPLLLIWRKVIVLCGVFRTMTCRTDWSLPFPSVVSLMILLDIGAANIVPPEA